MLKAHQNAKARNVSEAKSNEIGQDFNNKAVSPSESFHMKSAGFPFL